MKVLSQVASIGEPRYLQVAQGNYWFSLRGYELASFHHEDLLAGKFDGDLADPNSVIVFAAVTVVRDAIRRCGRPDPPNLDVPPELACFIRRNLGETTMGSVRDWERDGSAKLPVHIKPRDRHKLFTGKVVALFRDLISLAHIPPEEPVIWQEVVDMQSEWRASILRGQIINVAHYKGNPLLFPDPRVMQDAVKQFASAPIGYAMDWAVNSAGDTILVEVNDGFALGNYGVPGHLYTALIEARWREIMGLPDNNVGSMV
jgi:hypothetical protein